MEKQKELSPIQVIELENAKMYSAILGQMIDSLFVAVNDSVDRVTKQDEVPYE